jgi:hypothetical protein
MSTDSALFLAKSLIASGRMNESWQEKTLAICRISGVGFECSHLKMLPSQGDHKEECLHISVDGEQKTCRCIKERT